MGCKREVFISLGKEFKRITGIEVKLDTMLLMMGNFDLDIIDLDNKLKDDGYVEDDKTSMSDYILGNYGKRANIIIAKLIG